MVTDERIPRVLIVIERGIIQSICSTEPIEIKILDHDNLSQGDTLQCKNVYEPDGIIAIEDMDLVINTALEAQEKKNGNGVTERESTGDFPSSTMPEQA